MTTTTNFNLELPDFTQSPWHDDINNNLIAIDTLLNTIIGIANYQGPWALSTLYAVNDVAMDIVTGVLYTCDVGHTSASTLAFSDDRTANPTYWSSTTFINGSTVVNFNGGTR